MPGNQRPRSAARLASSTAGAAGDDSESLIAATKAFMDRGNGFYSEADPNLFADDFCFRGEILGPMNKAGYIKNLGFFRLYDAFPDIQPNSGSFTVDAANPRRVWFINRVTGTHKGAIPIPLAPGVPYSFPATGSVIAGGPEMLSVVWDREMRVKMLTVGYVISPEGTNGGFGAAFGLLYGCGVDARLLRAVHDNIGVALTVSKLFNRVDPSFPLPQAFDRDVPTWWRTFERTGVVPV